MATRINNINELIEATPDLRQQAKEIVTKRESLRRLGKMIAKGVAFDQTDNTMVLVNNKSFELVH